MIYLILSVVICVMVVIILVKNVCINQLKNEWDLVYSENRKQFKQIEDLRNSNRHFQEKYEESEKMKMVYFVAQVKTADKLIESDQMLDLYIERDFEKIN